MRICEHPRISQQALSDMICVDKSTTTRAIQKLEHDGYVIRERNLKDSRKLAVLPTELGLSIYPELVRFELYLLRLLQKQIPEETRSMLTSTFDNFNVITDANNATIEAQAKSQLEIKLASTRVLLQQCYDIRIEVFQKGQGVSEDIDFDGRDNDSANYIAHFNGVPAGTVRLRPISDDTVKLERLAVLPSFRNLSIASALVEFCTINAAHKQYKIIKLHAQMDALSLYTKAGFQVIGDVFYEANIAHVRVEKAL